MLAPSLRSSSAQLETAAALERASASPAMAAALVEGLIRTDVLKHAYAKLGVTSRVELARSRCGADVRLPTVSPDTIAQIQYTSGITGLSKGVLIHHRGLTNAARLRAHGLGATWRVLAQPQPAFPRLGLGIHDPWASPAARRHPASGRTQALGAVGEVLVRTGPGHAGRAVPLCSAAVAGRAALAIPRAWRAGLEGGLSLTAGQRHEREPMRRPRSRAPGRQVAHASPRRCNWDSAT
jgi:AMP-binding enzyme